MIPVLYLLHTYQRKHFSMTKIISFCNQKGGVGKTTTCVNVSAYMALLDKKTLLIDLDPQGNATSAVGIDKSKDIKTIYDLISLNENIDKVIMNTEIKNLDIIPSEINLAGTEIELVQTNHREFVLKNILSTIKTNYDFVMIDCPPSLNLLTINALTASDSVIIPIQCEFFALEGLSQLMNTIRLVRLHLNNELNIEGVVLTMKDNRTLVNQVSEEIKKFFGKKVYNTIIPRNTKLAEAPSYGKSVFLYSATSKGAIAYKNLTEEILEKQN